MDYLRNLGSAAVSTLVQKSGLNLPFSLGQKVPYDGIWSLYEATKRDDGSPVSVFEFDAFDPQKKVHLPLARNALRKLRSTRHPEVVKFVDSVESDSTIYIITERVRPLSTVLKSWSTKSEKEKEEWIVWGLHRISVALTFLNDPCTSTHGYLRASSIFISHSGEWRLAGFELLSNQKDDQAVLYTMGGMMPDAMPWAPPEVKKNSWSGLKDQDPAAADAYSLGLLLHTLFNPNHPLPPTAEPPHPPPQPSSRGSIPTYLFNVYKKLLNPNPRARLTPKAFLEIGTADGGFFASNKLVQVCAGLDNFSLASEGEKNGLLRNLKESSGSLPAEFISHRILPSLISALEFGGASASLILPLVLQFGETCDDYTSVVLAPLVKLYASPDRGTRMSLLDHLPEYAEKLDKKTVSDKIWPHLQTGFMDTVAVIREATIRAISLLSSKLNERILNNELLRHLAKLQADPEPSIRTNTCILLGRLGPELGYNTKRKVLVPAFTRALKDPFVHARVAGLMAFMATVECFDIEDVASKVIPNMSFTLIDKEKLVRDQAFKALDIFVKKLETHAATMPETSLTDASSGGATSPSIVSQAPAGIVNSAAGAAGALAGWAITSLGKKLAQNEMQSAMSAAAGAAIERALSAPASEDNSKSLPGGFPSGSTQLSGGLRSALPTQTSFTLGSTSTSTINGGTIPKSKSKGMQLGASKVPQGSLAEEWAEEAAAEVGLGVNASGENPWGGDDLMDVNADDDDWSAFESAPAVPPSPAPPAPPTPKVVAPQPVRAATVPKPIAIVSSSSAPAHTESKPTTPTPTSSMSKEDKAAELARKKEERKQRIAKLKEQKQNAAAKS